MIELHLKYLLCFLYCPLSHQGNISDAVRSFAERIVIRSGTVYRES